MVPAAAAADGIFLQAAPAGGRFAGVVDAGLGAGDRIDVFSRQGGDARQSPQQVQQQTLGGQHAPRRSFDRADAPAALDQPSVLGLRRPTEPGIEFLQRQGDGGQAGDHSGLTHDNRPPAHGVLRNQRVAGPITLPAEVLVQRQFQQPPPIVLKLGVPGDLMEFFGHVRDLRLGRCLSAVPRPSLHTHLQVGEGRKWRSWASVGGCVFNPGSS